jgi:hypothetical protein
MIVQELAKVAFEYLPLLGMFVWSFVSVIISDISKTGGQGSTVYQMAQSFSLNFTVGGFSTILSLLTVDKKVGTTGSSTIYALAIMLLVIALLLPAASNNLKKNLQKWTVLTISWLLALMVSGLSIYFFNLNST